MTVKELKKALDKKGIEYGKDDLKADLEELLAAASDETEAPAVNVPIGTNNKPMIPCPHTGQWMNDYS